MRGDHSDSSEGVEAKKTNGHEAGRGPAAGQGLWPATETAALTSTEAGYPSFAAGY